MHLFQNWRDKVISESPNLFFLSYDHIAYASRLPVFDKESEPCGFLLAEMGRRHPNANRAIPITRLKQRCSMCLPGSKKGGSKKNHNRTIRHENFFKNAIVFKTRTISIHLQLLTSHNFYGESVRVGSTIRENV